jgi:Ca-activated chloride channel family protein
VLPTRAGLALAFSAFAALVALAQGQTPMDQAVREKDVLKSGVDVVMVAATVVDAEGRLITGLPRETFEVFEDGDKQTITQFTSERVPIGLGMLLDISDSMVGRRIVDARGAIERFLFQLLSPDDQFFVLTFNHAPHLLTRWGRDAEVVRQVLDEVKPTGATAIYDAILHSLPMIQQRQRPRAAVVVVSDGADTASDASLSEVRTALLRSDAFVYAVAIDSPRSRARAGVTPRSFTTRRNCRRRRRELRKS